MYQNTLKDLVDQSGDTQILNNRIERTESMILDVKHAKDLDISTINSDIYIWNDTLDRLDIDVPHLEPVPDNYNRERVEQLKTQMRGVLGRLRNRYYLNIFIKPFQIAKK
ncbi:hypothetical protein [Lentilactobacillus senioris]|nr:hypothetical protein [Lentilactobacillus senioris]